MDANGIETARNFLTEWSELVLRDRNHPSLLIWTPMNEEWWPDRVQYPRFTADLYDLTKALDPTRPVNDASGGVHIKTDIWTVHNYEQDPARLKEIIYKDGVFSRRRCGPSGSLRPTSASTACGRTTATSFRFTTGRCRS